MNVENLEIGMLAKSKAGHDKGHIYVIYKIEEAYVYLIDGSIRTMNRPKKKKKKHLQFIGKRYDISCMDDVGVKRILKLFDKETGRI